MAAVKTGAASSARSLTRCVGPAGGGSTAVSDWTARYFAEAYGERWALGGPTPRTDDEVRFFLSCLGLGPGNRLLDLACGHGKYALAAAHAGVEVVAVDAASSLLCRGKELAQHAGVEIKWLRADMRRLPLAREFDGALLLDSFGFQDSPAECERVLVELHRVVRPGGRVVFAVVNAGPLVACFRPHDEELTARGRIRIARTLETSPFRVIERLSFEGREATSSYERRQYLFSAQDVEIMNSRAGFIVVGIYGGYAGDKFSPEASSKIVFVGESLQ